MGRRTVGLGRQVIDRLRTESGSALLLVAVTVVALVWANSPLSAGYEQLWEQHLVVAVGGMSIDLSVRHWVNDGLMVMFFFLIGLEVREELAVGSLRQRSRALVPLLAGLAGIVVPAAIYLLIAGRDAPQGWGAVVGTDTAFMLGVLALVGPRMSNQLRIFLLALTVVDDFLAVSIIGVVYTENLRIGPLLVAAAGLLLLFVLGRTRQWRSAPYIFVIVIVWGGTLFSGVHPSIAGMAAGLLVPARETERTDVDQTRQLFRDYTQAPAASAARSVRVGLARSISVNQRLHEVLRGPVSLFVVPIFALANAGVDLRGGVLADSLGSPVTWGVTAGLVIGKLVGIGVGAFLAVRLGLGRLPQGVGPGSVAGGAALSGIGFTMSLLIIGLAFDPEDRGAPTVGVLIAMVLATGLGRLIFVVAREKLGETSADLPTQLTPPVDHERDHVIGPEDAPFTLVEYADFECPFCARATTSWHDLKEHADGRLRYVMRHLPLTDYHPHALDAAIASEAAARQGRFWDWHDRLYENQDRLEPADLRDHAEHLGLDLAAFERDLTDPELRARVAEDAESAHHSGAMGTPTFFVNGTRHTGAFDARTLTAALDAAEPDVTARRRS